MTQAAARSLSKVWVFYPEKGAADTWYQVTKYAHGFRVAGTGKHGSYEVVRHPDSYYMCGCEGWAWSIERNPEGMPAYCRHLVCIGVALDLVAQLGSEAELAAAEVALVKVKVQPAAPSRRAQVPMMVDMDPFSEVA